MIYVADTENLGLYEFATESEAIGYCEGIDVEAATYLFWDGNGEPLEAEFTTPNKRGLFTVESGIYYLVPATANHHAHLSEAIEEITHLEQSVSGRSLEEIRDIFVNP